MCSNDLMTKTKLFKIGDVIPKTGMYICVPCGFVTEFFEGEMFLTCEACLAGTPDGPYGFQEEQDEFWQLYDDYLENPTF